VSQVDRPLAVVNGVGTAGVAVWNVSVDHLNRPVLMTNSLTTAMWTAVWQPWGGAHSITGTATLDTRFPGQWYQSETGLHYNWHRSYDPTVGRYTQPDPLGFVDGPSVYGYAGGSPQANTDPTGENILGPVAGGIVWFCARNPAACREIRDCVRSPEKCKAKFCTTARDVTDVCKKSVPSCTSMTDPSVANATMRAAELCLAMRDAYDAFCPERKSTTKHQQPYNEERQQHLNRIANCQKVCGSRQIYPFDKVIPPSYWGPR
jgi:RHS repeat-associated protein